jgi:PPK2 family polyphosphate:nucleotide phosphotransferase
MKRIDPADYQAKPGQTIKLHEWPTRVPPLHRSKDVYERLLAKHTQELSEQQDLLYASNEYALLIIFQAMDAAGKDSAIKHVMSGVNPQGCEVFSFKQPGLEELEHDFLWNGVRRLPQRGRIGIFNRSYYEEVLVVRVHPELLQAEHLPLEARKDSVWKHRFDSIVNVERHLWRNGTRIIKFFLHLSKEEQRKRFLKRIDKHDKNWKFSTSDMKERKYWREYMHAYEACLSATSTEYAPWYIVPADEKDTARLIVSRVIVDTLDELKLSYPKLDQEHRRELESMRKLLEKD